jgi:quinol monooxygenase YgiN
MVSIKRKVNVALYAELEVKPGKEAALEALLKNAEQMAEAEAETVTWYALKLAPSRYAIYDTFGDEHGRNEHLSGQIAKTLLAKAPELLAKPPEIHKIDILAAKI